MGMVMREYRRDSTTMRPDDDDDGAMAQRRPSGPSAQGIGTPSTTHKASFDDTHGSLTTHTAHRRQVSPNKDAYGPSTRRTAPITPFAMTQPPVPPSISQPTIGAKWTRARTRMTRNEEQRSRQRRRRRVRRRRARQGRGRAR